MQGIEIELKKQATPTKIWNYLRTNIEKYNSDGVIIKITHDQMEYFESNGTVGHLTKESFRKVIKRLRDKA